MRIDQINKLDIKNFLKLLITNLKKNLLVYS